MQSYDKNYYVIPLKCNDVLVSACIAPPCCAELQVNVLVSVKLSKLADAWIPPALYVSEASSISMEGCISSEFYIAFESCNTTSTYLTQ